MATPSMKDPASWIFKQIKVNHGSAIVALLREFNTLQWHESLLEYSTEKATALVSWKDLVNNGAQWDHKSEIIEKFGKWSHDPTTNTFYFFDIWSNIHYGFIGAAAGFSEWMLLAGAGYAQVNAGTSPPGYWSRRFETLGDADFLAAFDDPLDQVAIKIGVNLYETRGGALTVDDLIKQVRSQKDSLSTRPEFSTSPENMPGFIGPMPGN